MCGHTSAKGDCKKKKVTGSGFCKGHTCPMDGCTSSKPSKDLDCGQHAEHKLPATDLVSGQVMYESGPALPSAASSNIVAARMGMYGNAAVKERKRSSRQVHCRGTDVRAIFSVRCSCDGAGAARFFFLVLVFFFLTWLDSLLLTFSTDQSAPCAFCSFSKPVCRVWRRRCRCRHVCYHRPGAERFNNHCHHHQYSRSRRPSLV